MIEHKMVLAAQIIILLVGAPMFFHLLIGLDRMTSKGSNAPWYVTTPLFIAFVCNVGMFASAWSGDMTLAFAFATAGYLSLSCYSLGVYKSGLVVSKCYGGEDETDTPKD